MVRSRMSAVRSGWFAGSWYPQDPTSVRTLINESIKMAASVAKEPVYGGVRFAVLPHAGLTYSGRGLAHLLSMDTSLIQRVLILAPSHNSVIPDNTLSFGQFSGFETPLGLLSSFKTGLEHQGPDATSVVQKEHAVEMVLPFLAFIQEKEQKEIQVAMALINHVSDHSVARSLAQRIAKALHLDETEDTLVIASSDFTHYGGRFGFTPYGSTLDKKTRTQISQNDLAIARMLADGELGPLFLSNRIGRNTICGLAASSIVSALAKRENMQGRVIDYYTSSDLSEQKASDLVAYATILWSQ